MPYFDLVASPEDCGPIDPLLFTGEDTAVVKPPPNDADVADVQDIKRRVSDCSTAYAMQLATLVHELTISISSSNPPSRRASVSSSDGNEPFLISPIVDETSLEAFEPFPDPGYACPGDFLTAHTRSCADFPGQRHGTGTCWCSIAQETAADPNSWLLATGELSERAEYALNHPCPTQLAMRDSFGNSLLHLLAALEGFQEYLLGILSISDGPSLCGRNAGGQTFLHVLHLEWFSNFSSPNSALKRLLAHIQEVCPDLVYEADVYGRTFFHRAQSVVRDAQVLREIIYMFDPGRASRRDAFGFNPVADTDATSQKPYMPPRCVEMNSPPRDMGLSLSDPGSGEGSFLAYHARLVQVIKDSYIDPRVEDSQGRNGLHCLAEAILSQQTLVRQVRSSRSSSFSSTNNGRPSLKRKRGSPDTINCVANPTIIVSPPWGPACPSLPPTIPQPTDGAALPTRLQHLQCLLHPSISVAVDHYDMRGRTPLMAFVEEIADDQDDRARTLQAILETLLRAPVSGRSGEGSISMVMEARNRRGETALLIAARLGRKVALATLLENGANVHARDASGRGLLEILDDEVGSARAAGDVGLYARLEACRALLTGRKEWGVEYVSRVVNGEGGVVREWKVRG
jgi:hypothetical protein